MPTPKIPKTKKLKPARDPGVVQLAANFEELLDLAEQITECAYVNVGGMKAWFLGERFDALSKIVKRHRPQKRELRGGHWIDKETGRAIDTKSPPRPEFPPDIKNPAEKFFYD